jgi:hypothetical protein
VLGKGLQERLLSDRSADEIRLEIRKRNTIYSSPRAAGYSTCHVLNIISIIPRPGEALSGDRLMPYRNTAWR